MANQQQFAHFGNPFLGIDAVGADLGTRDDPFFTASKVATALQNGIDVLVHPQSCLRFGSGNGAMGKSDALFRMTGLVSADGVKLGVYDDDLFDTRPMYDGLLYDSACAGTVWTHIGNNNWQRTITNVNMTNAKVWGNAFCGKSKGDVVMLRNMPSAAACVAERDIFCTSATSSLVTINTGSSKDSPAERFGDIAYSPSTQYAIASLDFVGCKNLRFEYGDLTGGYMGVWANNNVANNPGFTSRDLHFEGLRHYCQQQGTFWVMGSANHSTACDVTSFVLDVTFKNCESHSKFDPAATYNGQPGFSSGYGTHNGLQVQGNCGNIDYVDCPIFDGYRHCGTQFVIGQYNSVDGTWPRDIKFRGSDPKNRVRVENPPTCYGHPIGSFINGGITFENIDVYWNSNQSEFGGVGVVRNVRWLENVAPVDPSADAHNIGADICLWVGDIYSSVPHMSCYIEKLIVEDCLFDRPTNYAIVVMSSNLSGGAVGGVEMRHNTVIDTLGLPKLWPNTGVPPGIAPGTAGPNAAVFLCDGGQGSSTSGVPQILENNVVVGGPALVAVKQAGSQLSVKVFTPNDPTYPGTNPLAGNATHATLEAAGMRAGGQLLSGSPLIHAGVAGPCVTDGNGRPFNDPPSIGAYEAVSRDMPPIDPDPIEPPPVEEGEAPFFILKAEMTGPNTFIFSGGGRIR